jgi:hypothetical protein
VTACWDIKKRLLAVSMNTAIIQYNGQLQLLYGLMVGSSVKTSKGNEEVWNWKGCYLCQWLQQHKVKEQRKSRQKFVSVRTAVRTAAPTDVTTSFL